MVKMINSIEYLFDAGPYEDAKELYKGMMTILSPDYDSAMELFQDKLTEVAEYVYRTTREHMADDIEERCRKMAHADEWVGYPMRITCLSCLRIASFVRGEDD